MKKCLVSLVSDQTIPNVLIAAHYAPDYLLFITTATMEDRGKSASILETLALRGQDYHDRHHKIVVAADSIVDLQNRVSEWIHQCPEEFTFVVNLTGGTKLMAIAAYDVFMDFGSEMVYLPIPKNEILTPFPKRRPRPPVALHERLCVQEYLTAYGFKTTNRNKIEHHKQRCRSRTQLTRHLLAHYRDLHPLLEALGDQVRPLRKSALKRGCEIQMAFECRNHHESEFLSLMGFRHEGQQIGKTIHREEWEYLRGGWLEERLFLAVDEALPHGGDICLNVMCEDPAGNRNEFDVLFTLDNVLYLVECKSLGRLQDDEKDIINAFLYKLGALRQNFGLTPKAFLATTSPGVLDEHGNLKQHLAERGRQFSTEIIPLLKTDDLEAYFRERLI
ncbi:Card1-like endonuclease domain-containing protein [Desulfoferrobacter suflitae]|uniref:Card1-like endonuclease domain-containing protein n=1 Tax=Desulfoferrobacter suflitae TaxID=2865782 RepID=UPI002164DE1E|nr:DUF1887 family CARF protein [Desulfoferrobacter suflitae]MCK8603009.1 DUF1887 family CARF protein [Desulfoferrobacter suflitae]